MAHSAEEKIKILYEDSLKDIRELTDRIEAVRGSVVDAARAAGEAQLLAFERNDAQLKDYSEKLLKFTADQAARLASMSQQSIDGLSAAAAGEQRKLGQYAGSLRNGIVRELGAEVSELVKKELGQVNATVHQFKPALDGYAARIAQLAGDLDGYAIKSAGRNREANAEAAKLLAEATTEQMGRLYAQTWLFCGLSALVGGAVALLVHVLLK